MSFGHVAGKVIPSNFSLYVLPPLGTGSLDIWENVTGSGEFFSCLWKEWILRGLGFGCSVYLGFQSVWVPESGETFELFADRAIFVWTWSWLVLRSFDREYSRVMKLWSFDGCSCFYFHLLRLWSSSLELWLANWYCCLLDNFWKTHCQKVWSTDCIGQWPKQYVSGSRVICK